MNTITLKRCQETLQRRKFEILPVLKHLHEESETVTGERHSDWLDQAWDGSEAPRIDRLKDCYRRELAAIERALSRISTGTYGSCLACHQEIEKWRLDQFPETEFCLGCQNFRETFEAA